MSVRRIYECSCDGCGRLFSQIEGADPPQPLIGEPFKLLHVHVGTGGDLRSQIACSQTCVASIIERAGRDERRKAYDAGQRSTGPVGAR